MPNLEKFRLTLLFSYMLSQGHGPLHIVCHVGRKRVKTSVNILFTAAYPLIAVEMICDAHVLILFDMACDKDSLFCRDWYFIQEILDYLNVKILKQLRMKVILNELRHFGRY